MSKKTTELTTTSTEVAKASPLYALASRFSIEPAKLVEVLRGTVIKPDKSGKAATNEEMAAFCIVAQQYNLNPFTKEIHAFASGDKGIVPIVGIDGWTKIVNAHDDFDGTEFDYVHDADGKPLSCTCRIYSKGRSRPVEVTEYMSECKRNSIPWQTMPSRMLRHKAFMQAARYAFGLAGIYDDDEARDIMRNGSTSAPTPTAVSEQAESTLRGRKSPEKVAEATSTRLEPKTEDVEVIEELELEEVPS